MPSVSGWNRLHRGLCTFSHAVFISGERGEGSVSGKPLHYKGAPFHRVVKSFMIQSGDFTKGKKLPSIT